MVSKIKVTLKPHQLLMKEFLLTHKHACLFCEAGTGKTFPTIEAINEVAKDGNILIVSTKNVIENMWKKDIDKYYDLPKNTTLINFERCIGSMYKELCAKRWRVIVVDECHKVKGHNSKISKFVHRISANAEYVWGLTGTPRGNTDIDIFCIFRHLHIDGWGGTSYTTFVDQYCACEEKFFGARTFKIPVGIREPYKNAWDKCVLANSFKYTLDDLRRDYEDVKLKALKEPNVITIPYEKTELYNNAIKGIIDIQEEKETMTKLSAILKAHQACNGYIYLEDGAVQEIEQENLKLSYISNLPDKKMIIVYRFNQDKEVLLKAYKDATDDYDLFKSGKYRYLLLQCNKCEGLNLQECTRIVFYTMDYSYIKFNQIYHRIYRIGQTNDINIDILIYKGTIEQNIWWAVKGKHTLSNLFFSIGK